MTHASNTYPTFGALPLVPSADALDLQAAIKYTTGCSEIQAWGLWVDSSVSSHLHGN